jgi:hypothetical protein
LNTLDLLDKKVEGAPLDSNEIAMKQYLNNRLADVERRGNEMVSMGKGEGIVIGGFEYEIFSACCE